MIWWRLKKSNHRFRIAWGTRRVQSVTESMRWRKSWCCVSVGYVKWNCFVTAGSTGNIAYCAVPQVTVVCIFTFRFTYKYLYVSNAQWELWKCDEEMWALCLFAGAEPKGAATPYKQKLKNGFCRRDDVSRCAWFTLQPKSATALSTTQFKKTIMLLALC